MLSHILFRRMAPFARRALSQLPRVKLKPILCATSPVAVAVAAAVAQFSYSESEGAVPERPSVPASLPESELSHAFLVRQSCVVSADSAAAVLTRYVTMVQDAVDSYAAVTSELAK